MSAAADQKTPRFFEDPAIDRLTATMLQLASEVWVLNERFAALQAVADQKGVITAAELAAFQFAGPEDAAISEARIAFIRRVLGPLNAPD
jgi:hypothetical protein